MDIRRGWGARARGAILVLSLLAVCQSASAGQIVIVSDPSGLSAEVEFTLLDPTTLVVRVENTLTGVPLGFTSADQLLTSVSWDFSPIGLSGTAITGGSVVIGPTSASSNFSTGSYGAGADVSGEYGYGNSGGTGLLPNFISGNTSGATPFGGANLDGPANLNGPQAGLVANPAARFVGWAGRDSERNCRHAHVVQPDRRFELSRQRRDRRVRLRRGVSHNAHNSRAVVGIAGGAGHERPAGSPAAMQGIVGSSAVAARVRPRWDARQCAIDVRRAPTLPRPLPGSEGSYRTGRAPPCRLKLVRAFAHTSHRRMACLKAAILSAPRGMNSWPT